MNERIKENLLRIQENIAPCKPKIIAVTKYFGIDAIIDAYDCGIRDFGESRVLESKEKFAQLPSEILENSTFHFIGHLQSNKVKQAIECFDYIHSVDSLKIAQCISKHSIEMGKVQNVFLQLNNANEEQKFGFSKDEIFETFNKLKQLSGINIVGLMNIAPLGIDEKTLEDLFKDVRQTKKRLETDYNCELPELSMGMSQDYKIAVQQGATIIRIGRKLFI